MNLFRIYDGSLFAHVSLFLISKHNIKENVIKRNIWGPFYIPKGEGLGGDQRRWKIVMSQRRRLYQPQPG